MARRLMRELKDIYKKQRLPEGLDGVAKTDLSMCLRSGQKSIVQLITPSLSFTTIQFLMMMQTAQHTKPHDWEFRAL